MSMEDVILVATVREEIRGGELRFDVADIPCYIGMVQAGRPISLGVNEVYGDKPKIGTTKKQHRGTKEGDIYEGDLDSSVSLLRIVAPDLRYE